MGRAPHNFAEHGIEVSGLKANLEQMIARKADVIAQTCNGIKFLMDKNKIDVLTGVGSIVDKTTVKVTDKDGKESLITTKNMILATGSKPNFFPGMEPDKKRIITSTEALRI